MAQRRGKISRGVTAENMMLPAVTVVTPLTCVKFGGREAQLPRLPGRIH